MQLAHLKSYLIEIVSKVVIYGNKIVTADVQHYEQMIYLLDLISSL